MQNVLGGLTQVNLTAADVTAARDRYAEFLGTAPYFQRPDEARPEYVEFRIGDSEDELGIVDQKHMPRAGTTAGGAIARWHVEDLAGIFQRLMDLGAREHEPVVEREAGFWTASVVDPFR